MRIFYLIIFFQVAKVANIGNFCEICLLTNHITHIELQRHMRHSSLDFILAIIDSIYCNKTANKRSTSLAVTIFGNGSSELKALITASAIDTLLFGSNVRLGVTTSCT